MGVGFFRIRIEKFDHAISNVMVPRAGLEPARSCLRGILSPLCLPIPPPGQLVCSINTFLAVGILKKLSTKLE